MDIGMVGLGRMGGNMVQRLLRAGHRVVAYDRDSKAVHQAEGHGGVGASSLAELARALKPPRAVWIMVPAGDPVDQTIAALMPYLSVGDVLVDGGNSNYKDSMRRASELKPKGIHFLDVGTSGGVWGLQEGYCLMVGGDEATFQSLETIFRALAPPGGYAHVGPSGAGHFVKMVHNGIEYGMMQAYAEGFDLLHAKEEFRLDLRQVAVLWQHGSVVRSWLLELAAHALTRDPELKALRGYVEDSGEGRWTVTESVDLAVPLPVITLSLQMRFRSRQEESFGAKLLAAVRREFGGHEVKEA